MSKLAKIAQNWDEIGNAGLTVGIKPIRIVEVNDFENDEYIEILFDIAAGPEKDFFANKQKEDGKWNGNGKFRKYYRDNTVRFFKAFITAVEKSNDGYNFAQTKGDVKQLTGKIVYGIFEKQETTMVGDDGKPVVLVKLNADNLRSKQAFLNKEIEAPDENYIRPLNDWGKKQFEENLKEAGVTPQQDEYVAADTVINVEDDLPF